MNKRFQGFFSALSFLTVIPVPQRLSGGPENLGSSVIWFPAAGLVIGFFAYTLDSLFFSFFPPLLRSVFCMLFFISISKGLHLDGLADTADGFLSSRPKEKILEIMRDSRIGTMGAAAVTALMILKTASLFSIDGRFRTQAVILAPVAGRCSMAIIMAFFEYARKEGGLASVFYESMDRRKGIISAFCLFFACFIFSGSYGILISIFIILFILLWGLYSRKMIGGFTGDTLGAGCELSEAFIIVCFTLLT